MSSFGASDAELRAFMGMDAIHFHIRPAAWNMFRTDYLELLTNPLGTICGKSLREAFTIFANDTWPEVVDFLTARIAEWKIVGNNLEVDTPRPNDGDGKLRFYAGETAALRKNPVKAALLQECMEMLKAGQSIPEEHLIETILSTPGIFACFLFSVKKNKHIYDEFKLWFDSLTKDQQDILLRAPAEIQALCMHIVWIYANCRGNYTLQSVNFDPVVQAICGYNQTTEKLIKLHEFPTFEKLSNIIDSITDAGSYGNLAEISEYAAGYVGVWFARTEKTAIYTGMDTTKFVEFAKLAIDADKP